MSATRFPHGIDTPFITGCAVGGGGDVTIIQGDQQNTGAVYYVNNSTSGLLPGAIGGSDGNSGTNPLEPFSTLDYAIGRCVANRADTIYVMPGHAETIATAGAITADVAGVEIIGVGVGDDKPVFKFSTTASTFLVTADNVKIKNIIGVPSVDSVVTAFIVSGDGFEGDIEWKDATALIEAITAVRLDTSNNSKLNLVYKGFTAGDAIVRAVAVDDCNNVKINIDAYGVCTTAWVNFVDVKSVNVTVSGYMYTHAITNFTRDVVDTVTSSTWFASFIDGSFGGKVSGGSGSALASDDVSTLSAAVAVVDGLHDVPIADAATDLYIRDVVGIKTDTVAGTSLMSLAKVEAAARLVPTADAADNVDMADVIGNKTDTVAGNSLYALGLLQQAELNKIDAATLAVAPVAGSMARFVASGGTALGTQLPDSTSLYDIVAGTNGHPAFPAAALPANGISMLEVLHEAYDQGEKAVSGSTAVMANGDTIFTIANGPIKIVDLVSVCITFNNATASTLQYSADPTVGGATTFSGATASLANFAAGGGAVLNQTALVTAPDLSVVLVGLGSVSTNKIIVNEGIITVVIGGGSTTGTWKHYLRYIPLGRGVTVTGT